MLLLSLRVSLSDSSVNTEPFREAITLTTLFVVALRFVDRNPSPIRFGLSFTAIVTRSVPGQIFHWVNNPTLIRDARLQTIRGSRDSIGSPREFEYFANIG